MISRADIRASLILALASAIVACGAAADEATPPEIRSGVSGYLAAAAIADSVALLPLPPATGSAELRSDQDINRADLALQGAPRWRLAGMDANLSFPWAAGDFSCALDAPVTLQDTPRLYQLLRRTLSDVGRSTSAAKNRYQRPRPFTVNDAPTCTPGAEPALRESGSYPSGHAAIGWAWALILSEASPDQSAAILARGRAFGESRLVCNVHWNSDVVEGRLLGAAAVVQLHRDATFLADLDAAKSELAAARAKKLRPQRDCRFEADALAQRPPRAP